MFCLKTYFFPTCLFCCILYSLHQTSFCVETAYCTHAHVLLKFWNLGRNTFHVVFPVFSFVRTSTQHLSVWRPHAQNGVLIFESREKKKWTAKYISSIWQRSFVFTKILFWIMCNTCFSDRFWFHCTAQTVVFISSRFLRSHTLPSVRQPGNLRIYTNASQHKPTGLYYAFRLLSGS